MLLLYVISLYNKNFLLFSWSLYRGQWLCEIKVGPDEILDLKGTIDTLKNWNYSNSIWSPFITIHLGFFYKNSLYQIHYLLQHPKFQYCQKDWKTYPSGTKINSHINFLYYWMDYIKISFRLLIYRFYLCSSY